MSMGSLAVVQEWLDAVNHGDGRRVESLSAEDVEVAGPRGSARGRRVLSEWLARAGFSAEADRWFCGADGGVVVTQRARWVDPVTGAERGRAVVASQFRVEESAIARFQRHDDLSAALTAAGLTTADEVFARRAG